MAEAGPGGEVAATSWRTWLTTAGQVLPWALLIGSFAQYQFGLIRADATGAADSRYATQHQKEFEALVMTRFGEDRARMDQVDREREARTNIMNKTLADTADGLRAQIVELQKLFEQRSEFRTNEISGPNGLAARIAALEIKLCMLRGVSIAGCK